MNIESDFLMTINGHGVTAPSRIDVVNPADGKTFALAPNCTKEQLDEAVLSARAAFPDWAARPIAERADMLKQAGEALRAHATELTQLFTREHGRPIEAARLEVLGAADWLGAASELRPPFHIVENSASQRVETRYVPLGVVCAIAPWNFPIVLAIWKIAPALLAGNTVVLKPSPFTPLCSLKLGELLREVFPPGVLNVVCGDDSLGPMMTAHPGIDKISFTGSTSTGRKVMESAASSLKRLTLELGGNDAAIVMPDVDLDAVVPQIFMGSFYNSAQVCIATKRLYVHEDIYDGVRDRLAAIARATKVGDGTEADTMLGPVQNKRQYERLLSLLRSVQESGAPILQGTEVPSNGGYFVRLTIVDNPPEESRVVQEEAFGPILPMMKFSDVDDVIDRVNRSEYGLAAAVWCKDIQRATAIAHRLETGTVWINQNLNLRPDTPFAGRKQSGFGVENGVDGLLEFMAPQSIYSALAT
ncbi:MAG: aldehyde dehydrogenase family protein [Sinimarinibacterium sp.]|jgi:acyl-CoA reductase-like NAD-dependent aldehyde dehydrogenase